MMEKRLHPLEKEILDALLQDNEARAWELMEDMKLSDLTRLQDVAMALFSICRSKLAS